jgi:carboxymethylenebutenolidase
MAPLADQADAIHDAAFQGRFRQVVSTPNAEEERMSNLTQAQQAMLTTWQQHTYAEFGLKDPDAAVATMSEDPYVLLIPSGTGGVGRAGVHQFYAEQMLPNLPPDIELVSLSQIFGDDRIVEEFVIRFTHTLKMDWVLPGLPATNRKVEFVLVGIIGFQGGKVASEHLLWDQATVLYQLGVLDHPTAAAGLGSAAQLLKLSGQSATAP